MRWLLALRAGDAVAFSAMVEAASAVEVLASIRSPGCLGGSVGVDLAALDHIEVRRFERPPS